MYLSLSVDLAPDERGAAGFKRFTERLRGIDAAAPDLVLFGGERDGVMVPGRLESLVHLPWAAGIITRAAVAATLPALHGVPFHVARALSAIDFLTDGRAGWLPVCADHALLDRAYGGDYAIDDAAALTKYDDFIAATQALWNSWDQDALIIDQAGGAYLDSAKVRRVDYRGPYFQTQGPLNAPRPRQGHPLLVRDLDDLSATSNLPADFVLLGASSTAQATRMIAQLRDAPATAGTVILLKVGKGLSLDAATGIHGADGVHLTGLPDAAAVAAARAQLPELAVQGATARARFGLAWPPNPFTQKAFVR